MNRHEDLCRLIIYPYIDPSRRLHTGQGDWPHALVREQEHALGSVVASRKNMLEMLHAGPYRHGEILQTPPSGCGIGSPISSPLYEDSGIVYLGEFPALSCALVLSLQGERCRSGIFIVIFPFLPCLTSIDSALRGLCLAHSLCFIRLSVDVGYCDISLQVFESH